MNEHLIERIKNCPNLPSLPTIAVQVLELAQRDEVDIAEIAKLISKDPALSGKILKTVNSSFYGRSQAVSTISHALVILGLQSVKTLVLGFSLVNNLAKSKAKGFKHLAYWKHSIYNATSARLIAQKVGVVQTEEAFLVGLLSDIGMLVLDMVAGEEYSDCVAHATSHAEIAMHEQNAFNMTHADVSGLLAMAWKLPPLLTTPIRSHHTPAAVTDPSLAKLTEVVQLASRCADVFVDEQPALAIAETRELAKQRYNMDTAKVDALLAEIGQKTKEIAPLLEIQLSAAATFDAILKTASEALVNLSLQTQVQATQLQEQNAKLKEQALSDRLTGLANRTAFDQKIQELWDNAQSTRGEFSIILLDLDKFKSVNDTYGHPAGDEVLRVTGRIVRGAARSQDLAARYGGEEMAILLPDTPRAIAAMIAETLRKSIQAKPVEYEQLSIPVTASLGVASWEPSSPFKSLSHIVKAADLALYNAKQSGRNRVKVFTPAAPKTQAA